jgi:isoamylase
VPDDLRNRRWDIACDSFDPARKITASQELTVGSRSVVVLRSSS